MINRTGFFIHWIILKQNQEWEQWKFSSIFDFNKWNVTFCLYVFFLYLLLSMLTQWCDGCQCIRSNTKIQANNWNKKIFQIQFQWNFPDTDLNLVEKNILKIHACVHTFWSTHSICLLDYQGQKKNYNWKLYFLTPLRF